MDNYSDAVMAAGLNAGSPAETVDAAAQRVLANNELSLAAKGLFALLAEQAGSAVNPFENLFEKAEVVHSAVEELIAVGLIVRV